MAGIVGKAPVSRYCQSAELSAMFRRFVGSLRHSAVI
jgi:hypothetical protein